MSEEPLSHKSSANGLVGAIGKAIFLFFWRGGGGAEDGVCVPQMFYFSAGTNNTVFCCIMLSEQLLSNTIKKGYCYLLEEAQTLKLTFKTFILR